MKTTKCKLPIILLAAASLSALTACSAPPKQSKTADPFPAKSASSFNNREISGTVTAKSSTNLTIGGTKIAITENTSFVKDGRPIKLADVQLGDKVHVLATSAADGKLAAVTVQVVA